MSSNAAVNFLPIFSEEKKVEVSLQDDQAVIKLSTWTESLGWCVQKTMAFDGEMLEDLHRVISAARIKLNRQKAEEESAEENQTSRVLAFPSFA